MPQAILAASACSVTELVGMKDELVALRDRLNAAFSEWPVCGGFSSQSRLLANTRPEWDLRYFSKAGALYLSRKAQYQVNCQGLNFAVWICQHCDLIPPLQICGRAAAPRVARRANVVEPGGIEPPTSCMPCKRSPS